MNEIELARQQLLECRVDNLMVFIFTALVVMVSLAVAVVAAIMVIRDKSDDRFDRFGPIVLCALILASPFVPIALFSANELIDTYIAPNTIVPGYVAEK